MTERVGFDRARRVHLLMGPPGAGKTRFSRLLASRLREPVEVSTDDARRELYGSEAEAGDMRLVFDTVYAALRLAIRRAPDVVYEATNADREHRIRLLGRLRGWGATHITGYCFTTPLEVCLERNLARDRVTPPEEVERLFEQWRREPPSLKEGFDELIWAPQASS